MLDEEHYWTGACEAWLLTSGVLRRILDVSGARGAAAWAGRRSHDVGGLLGGRQR